MEPEPEAERPPIPGPVGVWRTPLQAATLRLQLAKLLHARLSPAADGFDVDVLALIGECVVSETAVVFAHGSSRCVVGFGCESSPRCSIASFVGVPRSLHALGPQGDLIVGPPGFPTKGAAVGYLVGDRAFELRGICRLRHPIERGIVVSWECMEQIWRHAFYSELAVPPEDCCALLTETALNPKATRERTVQIFFEVFKARALFLTTKEALTLHALGRTVGIVLTIGISVLAVPIYEGHTLPYAVLNPYELPNGHDVTDYMMRLLSEQGHDFVTTADREIAREMKERLCYVATDFEAEMAKDPATIQRDYELPNGPAQVFTIGQERFQCPEVLFRPSLLGRTGFEGIHRYVWTSITRCDLSVRREMLENVVLAGGCARFPGIAERFRNEIQALAQEAGDSDGSLRARVRQTWLLYTHTYP